MSKWFAPALIACALCFAQLSLIAPTTRGEPRGLKIGAASLAITPFGPERGWDGTITESGVWGEKFTDSNRNGRWDTGEPFEDDPGNDVLDPSSKGKYGTPSTFASSIARSRRQSTRLPRRPCLQL